MIEFLNTSQKIKKLRKMLRMRQHELSDEHITTSFISMIELGKRGISKDTAEKIAKKLNERAEKLGRPLNIDGEYLLYSPEEEAEVYCLQKLEKIKTIEDTKELMEICNKFHLERPESRVHRFLGDIYFENRNYQQAYIEYGYAIDLCKNNEEKVMQAYLYSRSGRCKAELFRYTEALFLYNRAYYYAEIYKDQGIIDQALYNIALCNKKLGNCDEAVRFVSEYLSQCEPKKDFETFVYANILKATCLQEKGEYDNALKIYKTLSKKFSELSDSAMGLIYTNMGSIYLDKGLYIESLESFGKAQKIRNNTDKYLLPSTLIEKSKVYIRQKFYDEAILLIELALEMAKNNNNKDCLLNGYRVLKEIYIAIGNKEKIKGIYENALDILRENGEYQQVLEITNILVGLYLKEDEILKAKECLMLSQECTSKKVNLVI